MLLFELIWDNMYTLDQDCAVETSQSSQDRLWAPARVDGVLQKTHDDVKCGQGSE